MTCGAELPVSGNGLLLATMLMSFTAKAADSGFHSFSGDTPYNSILCRSASLSYLGAEMREDVPAEADKLSCRQ